jgi:hypothetical protein
VVCAACLRSSITSSAQEGDAAKCFADSAGGPCGERLAAPDILAAFRDCPAELSGYRRAALTQFLTAADAAVKYCPTPSCNRLIEAAAGAAGGRFTCLNCSRTYCPSCNAWPHAGTTCAERAAQRERAGAARAPVFEASPHIAGTQKCPGCQRRWGKDLACNHVSCAACHTHFCFRCGVRLPEGSPYSHFREVGGPCYDKLFEQVDGINS